MIKYHINKRIDIVEVKECFNVRHAEKEHFHQELSIGIIEKGCTTVKLVNQVYKFAEKDLIIIPAEVVHDCNPDNIQSWKFTMLYINNDWFKQRFDFELDKTNLFYYRLNNQEYFFLKKYINNLKKGNDPVEIEKNLTVIIDQFLLQNYARLEKIKLSLPVEKKSQMIVKYIEDNFNKKITSKDMAAIFGVSKYHLIRSFKNSLKISPLTYQRCLRFNMAKKELKEGKDISNIAYGLGYYDQSHFTNEFYKFAGITPDAYRKNF